MVAMALLVVIPLMRLWWYHVQTILGKGQTTNEDMRGELYYQQYKQHVRARANLSPQASGLSVGSLRVWRRAADVSTRCIRTRPCFCCSWIFLILSGGGGGSPFFVCFFCVFFLLVCVFFFSLKLFLQARQKLLGVEVWAREEPPTPFRTILCRM